MPEMVTIAHTGKPCDPPIVDGVEFKHLEDGIWVGQGDEIWAASITRLEAFTRYGGSAQLPTEPAALPAATEIVVIPAAPEASAADATTAPAAPEAPEVLNLAAVSDEQLADLYKSRDAALGDLVKAKAGKVAIKAAEEEVEAVLAEIEKRSK